MSEPESAPEPPADGGPWTRTRRREPVFNAPWPAMTLALALIASFAIQQRIPEQVWADYVLTPAEVLQLGRWQTLITPIFLHGGWVHVLMNAVAALAFGSPVARLFGLRAGGALAFLVFFFLCGALSSMGYVLAHPVSLAPVVGASGAVSGLMGAASRLIERRGWLGPLISGTTIGMAIAWTGVNLLIGFVPIMPGLNGAGIAWEAHVAGYFAGLFLVGPFAHGLRRA
ncbi:MAG TPA: rhomboid family intramembrane serine protease [Caulobacteraceae bacterium]